MSKQCGMSVLVLRIVCVSLVRKKFRFFIAEFFLSVAQLEDTVLLVSLKSYVSKDICTQMLVLKTVLAI